MSEIEQRRLELPRELHERLLTYRKRIWWVKSLEAVAAALVGLLVSYLLVFLLDRFADTPAMLRLAILVVGVTGFALFLPKKLHRWVWRSREMEEVARLLRYRHRAFGDRLLGTVELIRGEEGKRASPALCRAAIEQVAIDSRSIEFADAVPRPRHRAWGIAAVSVLAVATSALFIPDAGWNAMQRWLSPWRDVPRYTFAQMESVPERLVAPLAEPFSLTVKLAPESVWKPATAKARYESQTDLTAELDGDTYRFDLPPQTEAGTLNVWIGDTVASVEVLPMARPELVSLAARIELPEYLQRGSVDRDARAGAFSVLSASRVVFDARASRALSLASVDGDDTGVKVSDDRLQTPVVEVNEASEYALSWVDVEGLSAKQPFVVRVAVSEDRAPTVHVAQLPPEQVVLVEQVVNFEVSAGDDFGVRRVGVEWTGVADPVHNPVPQQGEYPLGLGGPESTSLQTTGTFQAKSLGITPQPIHLRVWAQDYLPGRERTYSPVYRLFVLSPEDHMIWVTQQLRRWERQVLEVKDEEQRLLDENRELNALDRAELAEPGRRQQLEKQVARERANATRLKSLTDAGDQLIAEAARNEEFNAATLERWAETLKTLRRIAQKRMPSVANLLTKASVPGPPTPPPPPMPSISDVEAGANADPPPDAEKPLAQPPSKPPPGRLGLPTTTLQGAGSPPSGEAPPAPEGDDLAAAVEEQEKLLAEFESVMDEIAKLLEDLYGSTFVKRLKHAARQEKKLAANLRRELDRSFGDPSEDLNEGQRSTFDRLSTRHEETATRVSYIADDLGAFFDRSKEPKYDKVRREMRETKVVRVLREMSAAVPRNQQGETISQAEYWVDQLDRWAEILVGPG